MKGMQIANGPGNQRRERKISDEDSTDESVARKSNFLCPRVSTLESSSGRRVPVSNRAAAIVFWLRIKQRPLRFRFHQNIALAMPFVPRS